MVEGGNIELLMNEVVVVNNDMVVNLVEGLLVLISFIMVLFIISEGNNYLLLIVMLLFINDGFVGLDSWMILLEVGIYILYLNVYDVGIEVNDEWVVDGFGVMGMLGILVVLGGNVGMNVSGVISSESNMMVYIYFGNLGDDDFEGGMSDFNNIVYRWFNFVVMLIIIVK